LKPQSGDSKAEWVIVALGLVLAIFLTTSQVQAIAVSNPKMEHLEPEGKPWMLARVGESTEFQITVWGEENATVEISVENENALGFASFDPENFTLAPGESKQVRCIFTPTRVGIFKSSVVISESSRDNVQGSPIKGSIAFGVEVHVELPPAAPTLVSPENNAIENTLTVTFTWKPPGSGMRYHIQIDNEASFTSPYVHENEAIVENSYTYTFGESNEYHWRIRARDNVDNWSAWSEGFKLTVVLEEPAKLPIVPLILVICVIVAGVSLALLKLKFKRG